MNIPDKKNTFTASLCHHAHRTNISERLISVQYVPPSDATNTGCTVRDALYAIGYPGPVFNHLSTTDLWFRRSDRNSMTGLCGNASSI